MVDSFQSVHTTHLLPKSQSIPLQGMQNAWGSKERLAKRALQPSVAQNLVLVGVKNDSSDPEPLALAMIERQTQHTQPVVSLTAGYHQVTNSTKF